MTKRLFQNQKILAALKEQLHRGAIISREEEDIHIRKLAVSVQQHIAPRLHRSRLRWVLAATAVIAAVAAVAFVYGKWSPAASFMQTEITPVDNKSGTIVEVNGLITDLPLYQFVKVPKRGGAKFVMSDDSTVWTREESVLQLQSSDGELKLEKGQLLAAYAKRDHRTAIRTPGGTVEIIGTVFAVAVNGRSVEVRLFEGSVAVHFGTKTQRLSPGTYFHVENDRIAEKRPLDRSDVISALLITEKTFHLDGPKVPRLQIGSDASPAPNAAKSAVEAETSMPAKRKRTVQNRTIPTPAILKDTASDEKVTELQTPPPDEMVVEQGTDASLVEEKENLSDAEQLLEDACDNLRHGDHEYGKAQIRDYLQKHPDDRYWKHIHSIFE